MEMGACTHTVVHRFRKGKKKEFMPSHIGIGRNLPLSLSLSLYFNKLFPKGASLLMSSGLQL